MAKIYFKTEPQAVTESLCFFLLEDNPFKKETVKFLQEDHLTLKKIISKNKNINFQKKAIKDYVDEYFQKHKDELEAYNGNIHSVWTKLEKKVFQRLSELLNTDLKGLESIVCYMGIVRLYPRDLQSLSFQIYFKDYIFRSLATILHEVTHFIYFKKLRELFPNSIEDTFEAPMIIGI